MKVSIKRIAATFVVAGSLFSAYVHGANDFYLESHRLMYEHMINNYNFDHIKSDILVVRDMLLFKLYEKEVSSLEAERLLQKDDVKTKFFDYISVTFYEKMKKQVPASFDFDGECAFLGNVIINGHQDSNDVGMYDFIEASPVSGQAACCIALAYHVAKRNGYSPLLFSKGIRSFLAEELEKVTVKDFEKRSWLKKIAIGTFITSCIVFGYSFYRYKNQNDEERYIDYMKNKCSDGFDWTKDKCNQCTDWITNKWNAWRNPVAAED